MSDKKKTNIELVIKKVKSKIAPHKRGLQFSEEHQSKIGFKLQNGHTDIPPDPKPKTENKKK